MTQKQPSTKKPATDNTSIDVDADHDVEVLTPEERLNNLSAKIKSDFGRTPNAHRHTNR
jgi:hypothetical protein